MEFIQKFFEEMIYNEHYNIALYDTISNLLITERLKNNLTFRQWFNYQERLINWREHYRFEPKIIEKNIYRIAYETEDQVRETIKDAFRCYNKGIVNEKEFEIMKIEIRHMIKARSNFVKIRTIKRRICE